MLFSHQKLGKLEKQNIANKRLSSCRGVVLDIAFRTVYARYVSTIMSVYCLSLFLIQYLNWCICGKTVEETVLGSLYVPLKGLAYKVAFEITVQNNLFCF